MATGFGGSGKSGGGGGFGSGSGKFGKKDDDKWYSIFGNLAKDAKDAASGALIGLGALIVDPIQTVKSIGGQMWHDWSPLFKGQFGKFADQVIEHPLGYILDVAAVATLGAASGATLAARGGAALGRVGAETGRVARLGKTIEKKGFEWRPPTKPTRDLAFDLKGKRIGDTTPKGHFAPSAPRGQATRFYSRNAWTRMWQKKREKTYQAIYDNPQVRKLLDAMPKYGSPKYASYGARQLERALKKEHSAADVAAGVSRKKGKKEFAKDVAKAPALGPGKVDDVLFPEGIAHQVFSAGQAVNHLVPSSRKTLKDYFFGAWLRQSEITAARMNPEDGRIVEVRGENDRMYFDEMGETKAMEELGQSWQVKNLLDKNKDTVGSIVYRDTGGDTLHVQSIFTRAENADQFRRAYRFIEEVADGRTIDAGTVINPTLAKWLKRQQDKGKPVVFREYKPKEKPDPFGIRKESGKPEVQGGAAAQQAAMEAGRKATPIPAKITQKASHKPPKGYAYQAQDDYMMAQLERYAALKKLDLNDPAVFDELWDQFGRFATTNNWKKAAKDENGNFVLVHNHKAARWAEEAKGSNALVNGLFKAPSSLWRYMTLTTPRFLANNAVGTSLMAAITMNPVAFVGAAIDAVRSAKGAKGAEKFVDDGLTMYDRMGHLERYYLDIYAGFWDDIAEHTPALAKWPKATRILKKTLGLPYVGTYKIERAIRGTAINNTLRGQPEVKALMDEGMDFEKAAMQASAIPEVRMRVAREVEDKLGQYYHFTPEEEAIRSYVLPFYGWNRALANHVGRGLTAPKRDVLARLGMAATATEEQQGFPDYLRGSIPLGEEGEGFPGLPGQPGRFPMLYTGGMNPYMTAADMVGGVAGLVGAAPSETVLDSGVNPLITNFFGAITGNHPVSGKPIGGGFGGSLFHTYKETFWETPYVRLFRSIGADDPGTFEDSEGNELQRFSSNTTQEMLYNIMGLPIRLASSQAIKRVHGKQQKAGIL